MNRAGRPLFMKTYGKQNRKLEAWISPDNRKQVFASTSSSDLSIVEPSSPKPPAKRVRKRSTADISRELRPAKTKALSWTADISRELRLAKTKALSCLREQDSDEENIFIVHPPPQQQSNRKPFLRRAGRKARRIVSSSESDGETTTTRQPNPKRSQHTTARARTHTHPSPVLAPGKFVTHRRGATTTTAKHKAPKRKLSVLLAQLSLNSSDDFVQGGREEGGVVQRSFPRRAKQGRRRALANADSSLADLGNSGATNSKGFLRDISLNVSPERPCHRKPLFSSTPSSRSLPPPPSFLRPPISPSASDIISLSTTQEELDIPEDPLSLTELRQLSSLGQAVGQPEVGNREEPTPRGSTSLRSNGSRNGGSAIQDGVGEQPSPELFSAVACEQTDPGRAGEETEDGSHFVSATVGQDWLAEVVKERCLTRCCAVRLERVYKLHGDTTCSPCVDQTRSHDNGRSVDHVRSATRGQSIDHSVIRDPSRDHTGSVTEGQSVDRAVNDSGQSLGRIVSVSRTSEEPVRVEQRLTTHCEVQLGRLTVTRPHRETSLTVTRPHRETSLTETRPHRETSLTETRPHTSLTETRPHRETSLTVTRPHRETSLTETRPHRETSLTETRPHRETSLTETRPHRETSLTETRPHRETSLTVTQPHRETSLTETRPHRETSLTVTRPHRETSLLPSDHNPRSDSSTAGDHARSEHVPRDSLVPKEHVPRDSLVPKEHVPRDSLVPKDHVPRDSLVPKEHVPRDSLVPKEHVPRDSLVPKEHVPRDSLVPKEHVPRDSLVPKEHVPRDSLVPKEHVPRDSLVPKEHVPRDSLVPKEHVPRDSLVPKEHVPRDSLFPKEHVPKENPHRRKVGGAPIERRRRSVSRERPATSRKVCVSGVSVSRWGRRDGAPNSRAAPPPGRAGDCSITELLSAQHTHGVPILSDSMVLGTPVRGNRLHLSSLLVNLTPETHTWSRLKAALSLHRKTKAFLTPKRPLYLLSSPEAELEAELGDVSQKLFSTPRPPNLRSTIQGSTPLSVYSLDGELSDDQKVFLECNQTGPLGFQDCLPAARMKLCRKIGEGTFGEVFSTTNTSGDAVALKIIPVEGCDQVNGEEQKTFGEILHEIIISKELSSLKEKKHNQTTGFIGLKDLHCVKGCYPPSLLKAWDSFNTQRGSENDRPDFFNEEQLFLILEFEFGGSDLENSNGQLASVMVSKSILHQVTAALAVAEQELCFEHRDLHWGNVLVQSTKEKEGSFLLNGTNHSLETRGVSVRIIDYSLSRLEIDGLTVSCDISEDEELFQGHGDLQFDIYRLMRQENGNKWGDYQPHSNVLWLHYLSSKLLTMTYKSRGGRGVKQARLDLQRFHDDVLTFRSASDILYNCGLFQ
ncbi:uncharacterized protein LOC110512591 isoform X1 [Oncorhynchus mykiss]|uniref:uncharacterized protein LOC110512591 isoform X1 n=1 Tax=Oncorhynchus mykiss TaxID=8022 RepID=UPI0018786219|nr:uncharacterized protein LOC110512591 isoform X1 [Oncorhynchus mykiss]